MSNDVSNASDMTVGVGMDTLGYLDADGPVQPVKDVDQASMQELTPTGRLALYGDVCYCTDGYVEPTTGRLYTHLCKHLHYPIFNEPPYIKCKINNQTLIRHERQVYGNDRKDVWVPHPCKGCPNGKSHLAPMAARREDNVFAPSEKPSGDGVEDPGRDE